MSYLLDTNVISGSRKRQRGNPGVVGWAASVDPSDLHTSVLVIGEIRRGIEQKRRSDATQAAALDGWLATVRTGLMGRILPIDERVAELWGKPGSRRSIPSIDGLIAATALVHGLTMVTRNVKDMARTGAVLLNPFV
ncbi:MAG: type II toxin-antitoxin system VapC family toxin [Acetobacteraceae bacterium]|nr:type II toxin-antitoxin system VapC family toxin [Acetobacteraceae bacterium]